MTNEVLAKILCHNLVVLIHEMYELGIAPIFEAGRDSCLRKAARGAWGTRSGPPMSASQDRERARGDAEYREVGRGGRRGR